MAITVDINDKYYKFSGPMYKALYKAWINKGISSDLAKELAKFGTYQTANESGYGTSNIAVKYHNYGGMKSGKKDKNGNVIWQTFSDMDDFANGFVDNLLKKFPNSKTSESFQNYMNALFDYDYQYDPIKGKKQYSVDTLGTKKRVDLNIEHWLNSGNILDDVKKIDSSELNFNLNSVFPIFLNHENFQSWPPKLGKGGLFIKRK